MIFTIEWLKEYLNTNNIKSPKENINFNNKTIDEINNYKNFSVISIPGKNFGVRKTNQDTPVASFGINGIEGFNIFGVLDGQTDGLVLGQLEIEVGLHAT